MRFFFLQLLEKFKLGKSNQQSSIFMSHSLTHGLYVRLMVLSKEECEAATQVKTGRVTLQHPPLFHQTRMKRRVNAHCTCCMQPLCTCYTTTHIQPHVQLDQKSWLGNEGKGHASTNRCLALCFLEGLSLPLFEILGFLSTVVSPGLARQKLPFWQCLSQALE